MENRLKLNLHLAKNLVLRKDLKERTPRYFESLKYPRTPESLSDREIPRIKAPTLMQKRFFCSNVPVNPFPQKLNKSAQDCQKAHSKSFKYISPKEAIEKYSEFLEDFEKVEIMEYPQIYYIGLTDKKHNSKFADFEGHYITAIGDHLGYRYEIKKFLGKGTFGQVVECFDHKSQVSVAIKIIRNSEMYRRAGDLEDLLLNKLSKSVDLNYIVEKIGSFEFRSHLCIIFEVLSLSLEDLLNQRSYVGLPMPLVHRIAVQLLLGLKSIHACGIIHCDLKPENILLRNHKKSGIKIIDFGSACNENQKVFEYIQSRPYRAPEIVIESKYNKSIDIWSLGCILFELITGKQLFPAKSEKELFDLYIETIGEPPPEFFTTGKRKKYYLLQNGNLKSKAIAFDKCLEQTLSEIDPNVVDFIKKCLKWLSNERITVEDGLAHPWIQGKVT